MSKVTRFSGVMKSIVSGLRSRDLKTLNSMLGYKMQFPLSVQPMLQKAQYAAVFIDHA